MNKKQVILIISGLVMLFIFLSAIPILAADSKSAPKTSLIKKITGFFTNNQTLSNKNKSAIVPVKQSVSGKISVIDGPTLTIVSGSKTYTVDASAAKITKGVGRQVEDSVLSELKVGDMVLVSGKISDTKISATAVMILSVENIMKTAPVVSGKITAIKGMTLTVIGKNNTSYSVDITNAKLVGSFGKNISQISAANLRVGGAVSVSGTVSGTNIKASTVMATGIIIPRSPSISGKVTAVNGSSFAVQAIRNVENKTTIDYTVNTTFLTIFKNGNSLVSSSNLKVGETVIVLGMREGTSTVINATNVDIVANQTAPAKIVKISLLGKIINFFKKKN
jgi:hypothetical protein